MLMTGFHAKYYANALYHSVTGDRLENIIGTLADANVDINPHQVEAALFAQKSPFCRGVILGDEVGLGKTIEAGIVFAQKMAEGKRKVLLIIPANSRTQWKNEMLEKFYISCDILDSQSFNKSIDEGNINPFEAETPIIVSYNFAYEKADFIKQVNWDLVIIDEAHRLRNAYKPTSIIAKKLLDTLDNHFKLLLTATPFNNTLMELYGLSSFIDNYIFGNIESFKLQFSFIRSDNDPTLDDLIARVRQFCIRTLRRQVTEYIKYTERKLITQTFKPSAEEQDFYNKFSAYLRRDRLWAIPNSGRPLVSMVLWKLLASSTFAIAGTLDKLILRLEYMYEHGETVRNIKIKQVDDGIGFDSETPDVLPTIKRRKLNTEEMASLKREIDELKEYAALAHSIKTNAKGEALSIGIEKGFEQLKILKAPQKVVIFTESRRTQEYIYEILQHSKYKNEVVLYHGGLSSKKKDEAKALFRDKFNIMVATESAAESLNLQFSAMLINYDLPFNPQRIEQRIGRLHRYGQRFDVVVVNFLNENNIADRRVYELLCERFKLFDGVFGASDGILGSVDSLDFERRIVEIYQTCRTEQEIEKKFAELREMLSPEIDEKMSEIKRKILENFDDVVVERLKINNKNSHEYLSRYDSMLWNLTHYILADNAEFDDENRSFVLKNNPYYKSRFGYKRFGRNFIFKKDVPLDVRYRPKCSLAQTVIFDALNDHRGRYGEVVFDLTNYTGKISCLTPFIGKGGFLSLALMEICYPSRREKQLVFAGFCEDGTILTQDQMRRIFDLSGKECSLNLEIEEKKERLNELMQSEQNAIINTVSLQDTEWFNEELAKLDKWAQDVKQSMEKNIKNMDNEIAELRKQARNSSVLKDRLTIEKKIIELETKRNKQRFDLYTDQDKIDRQKEELVKETQEKLKQNVTSKTIFNMKWNII